MQPLKYRARAFQRNLNAWFAINGEGFRVGFITANIVIASCFAAILIKHWLA